MIIYNNKGNPYGLKIKICLKAAGSNIKYEELNPEELGKSSCQHFPVLELDNGDHIFSSDAIIKYILPNEEPMELRDQWLEWCSTRLAPVIISKSVGHQETSQAEVTLNHLILQLDEQLTKNNTPFLIGSKVTSADFSIWIVCKATLNEMLIEINKVDPKKTVEIGGYHLDSKKVKTIQLRRSETFLTDLMENICEKLDDYAKARFKSNGTLTMLKLTTPGGGMNPDMSSVDFIQDGDLNKNLKHFCLEILEDNEDAALELLMQEKIPEDNEVQLCSLAAKYCDDLPVENDDYVLEEHQEL